MLTQISGKRMLSLALAATASVCAVNVVGQSAGVTDRGGSSSGGSSSGDSSSGYLCCYIPSPEAQAAEARADKARAEAAAARAEERADRAAARQAERDERVRKAREIENTKRAAALAEERRLAAARRLAQERKTLGALQSAMHSELQSARKTHLVDQPNSNADFKRRDDETIHRAERELKEQTYRWDVAQEIIKSALNPDKPGLKTTIEDVSKLVKDNTRLGNFERKQKAAADAHELSRIVIKQSKPPAVEKDPFERTDDILKKVFPYPERR